MNKDNSMSMVAAGSVNTISFAEIVKGRDASVRVTVDGLIYVVDLVMVVTGKDRDHASQALRSISSDLFDTARFHERRLSSRYDCFNGCFPLAEKTRDKAIEKSH